MPRKATSEAKPKPRAVRSRKISLPPGPSVVPPAEEKPLDPEEVARLAYSYWLERGGKGGSPEEDWLRAEQKLKARGTGAGS